MTRHDLLVAGGGPAGLAVAIAGAQAGLDVAVCERRAGVLDKACGEGLMPGALAALQRLGVDPPGHDLTGIVYRQGATVARAAFPSTPGRGVRRTDLHAAMRRRVDELGIRILDQPVDTVEQDDREVRAGGLRARYLVAADGLRSPLRRAVGLAGPAERRVVRWGLRQHFTVAPFSDAVEVTWAQHGEAYVTPIAPDLVGVAVLSSRRATFDEHLAGFPALAARLDRATPATPVRGAGPLRQRARGRVAGRVLLAGDAAGYVDALTGEGLALAFAAAETLVDCVLRDDPQRYERRWRQISRRSRWITSGLLWARHRPLLAPRVVPLAAAVPPAFSFAVGQLAR